MALDQATAGFLATMGESDAKPIHECTPEEARSSGADLAELYGSGPEMTRVEEASVQDGEVPIRLLVPTGQPRGLIVYYHGGGWVIADIDEFDTLGRELAARSGFAVALVNYRKAPEHAYPAAVRDAWAGLEWAAKQQENIAGSAPLVVAGDSAGGNLAAVVARQARDSGGPRIDAQVLVYPVTDCDLDTGSYLDPENQLMLQRRTMIWFWDRYLPDTAARTDPDASPLRAAEYGGLPPAVVVLAEHDVLRDEGASYAAKLRQAGVPVRERVFAGQMHGFFQMINLLPASTDAVDHVAATLNEQFG